MKAAKGKKRTAWTVLILVIAIGAGVAAMVGRPGSTQVGHAGHHPNGGVHILPVKTIHPRRDADFHVTTRQLASVEPYFHAKLFARASGTVTSVAKGIHQRVRRGEVLIEIDVPELRKNVAIKESVVAQR